MTNEETPERIWIDTVDNKRLGHGAYNKPNQFGKSVEYVRADLLATVRAEKSEWQPIETAPKDGTEVLLVWHWDSGIHHGVSVVMTSWYCRTHAHLSRHKDCPNEPDCKEGWGAYAGRMSRWMPKPELPALEATENRKGEG